MNTSDTRSATYTKKGPGRVHKQTQRKPEAKPVFMDMNIYAFMRGKDLRNPVSTERKLFAQTH